MSPLLLRSNNISRWKSGNLPLANVAVFDLSTFVYSAYQYNHCPSLDQRIFFIDPFLVICLEVAKFLSYIKTFSLSIYAIRGIFTSGVVRIVEGSFIGTSDGIISVLTTTGGNVFTSLGLEFKYKKDSNSAKKVESKEIKRYWNIFLLSTSTQKW